MNSKKDNSSEYLVYTTSKGVSVFNHLEQLPDEEEFFWLDVRHPTKDDLCLLEKALSIHPLTIEDIQLGESREKCEYYDNYVFLSMQILDEEEFYGKLHTPLERMSLHSSNHPDAPVSAASLSPIPPYSSNHNSTCYLIILSQCLISIHWTILPFLPVILDRRIPLMDNRTAVTGDWLAYFIIDEAVDEFTRQASLLQSEIDTIDDLTLSLGRFDQMDMLRRIYQAHRRTTILLRLIQPKIEVVRNLTKRSQGYLQPRTIIYLRDVTDHLHTTRQDLVEFQETLDRCHDNYLGQADIELAMAGHRMNLNVKKMTAITFIIGSTVAISTIMGVNVRVPFNEFPNTPPFQGLLPFTLLIIFMLSICVTVFAVGRNRKWL